MNSKKQSLVFLVLFSILFAACANYSNNATLKTTSTVKGVTVTSLGTPAATLSQTAITVGTVTITSAQASDTSNVGNFITLFDPRSSEATVKVVKYAHNAAAENFETDTAYANQTIADLTVAHIAFGIYRSRSSH